MLRKRFLYRFFLLFFKAYSKKLVYLVNFKCNTYTHTLILIDMYVVYLYSRVVEYSADVNSNFSIFPFSLSLSIYFSLCPSLVAKVVSTFSYIFHLNLFYFGLFFVFSFCCITSFVTARVRTSCLTFVVFPLLLLLLYFAFFFHSVELSCAVIQSCVNIYSFFSFLSICAGIKVFQ